MHVFQQPRDLEKNLAMIAKFKGMDFLYFTARNVDMKTGKIRGKMLINGEWLRVISDIPKVIDISTFCGKHREEINYLRNRTYLTDPLTKRISKMKLQNILQTDLELKKHSIPSQRLNDFNELLNWLKEHSSVVLKPVYGRRGRGVYIIKKKKDFFLVGIQTEETEMTIEDLYQLYKKEFSINPYVIQKEMTSRTQTNDPFDCRIHLEKDGKGKWTVLNMSVRIGLGQKVISNISYGGGRVEIESFLKNNYGDKWKSVHNDLVELGLKLAYKIEEIRDVSLATLGLDVGIDSEGQLFIFEANSAPGTGAIKTEVALIRTDYYKYLLNQKT